MCMSLNLHISVSETRLFTKRKRKKDASLAFYCHWFHFYSEELMTCY